MKTKIVAAQTNIARVENLHCMNVYSQQGRIQDM